MPKRIAEATETTKVNSRAVVSMLMSLRRGTLCGPSTRMKWMLT